MNTTTSNTQIKSNKSQEPSLSDEELLVQYRETGDRELFAKLVHRYEGELFNYLRRYLGDTQMAEDVFQATFLQVHLKCDQFQKGRRFRPWLYTIATHQAIDARRRNKRHQMVSLDRNGTTGDEDVGKLIDLLVSSEPTPLEHVDARERGRHVQQAVSQLPEPMQAVVQLVYYQGMKYSDAAEVMSVPVGTVKSRLHSAIQKLSEIWTSTHAQNKVK
ncbi:MAG: RNA polymerase sigma factor [Proteobacteria bacterium]|nr:RNA polymerase sigma factor [Pseudomonadota bacterium]